MSVLVRFRPAHLLALLAAIVAIRASAQSPAPSASQKLEPVIRALEFLQLDYRVGGEGAYLVLEMGTERYGAPDAAFLTLVITPFTFGGESLQWYQLEARGLYSLGQCPHPDAARRAILESGSMLGSDVQFLYDGLSGRVHAQVAMPAPEGKLPARLLEAYLGMVLKAIDGLDPVVQRAMRSGLIDWPKLDRGPQEPKGELKVTPPKGGVPFTVGWAPWIEDRIFASTIVTCDPVLRAFARMDDAQREQLGRSLLAPGPTASDSTFSAWMKIADHLEQEYPPVAFRFWGPPGTEVSARARIDGFCGEVTASGMIDGMGNWDVDLMPDWNVEALVALEEPRRVVVHYVVECNGQQASGTREVTIDPVSVANLGMGFLATPQYVNEDHPWVRAVISEAKGLGIAGSLGYSGSETYPECVRQIYAVWTALRNRGVSYVTVHKNADSDAAGSQTVRQFHEAIAEQGANCADGSAAVASILRKLGFDVWLLHPKGHVLVGVHLGDSASDPDEEWIFLETTALGGVEPSPPDPDLAVTKAAPAIPERFRDENWGMFVEACSAGRAQADGDDVAWVRIAAARDLGMRPIPALGATFGRIPAPPKDLESMRASLREAKRAEQRRAEYVFEFPNVPDCAPYGSLEGLRDDVDAIERDSGALRRILGATGGDSIHARIARLWAAQLADLEPAVQAAIERFGGIPDWGYESLGVARGPWDIELDRDGESVRIDVKPIDRRVPDSWIAATERERRWVVVPESIMNDADFLLRSALANVAYRRDPGCFTRIAAELKHRLDGGAIGTAVAFREELFDRLRSLAPGEAEIQELADRARK